MFRFLLIASFVFASSIAAQLGDLCTLPNNGQGFCILDKDCPGIVELIRNGVKPKICGFQGLHSIVCCERQSIILTGTKSQEYCSKIYQSQSPPRADDGNSLTKEFPHMAALGYSYNGEIKWLCGGTLISNNFVITSAHCISTRLFGIVEHIRLGNVNLKTDTYGVVPQNFTIKRRIMHPAYNESSIYHDIALIELNGNAEFTSYVKPACLNTERSSLSDEPFTATGWDVTRFGSEHGGDLQKIELFERNIAECRRKYLNHRMLHLGVISDWQICANAHGIDTCQGDSGGPLQRRKHNYHKIHGITSFGKTCDLRDIPGIYTRVSHYIKWIENIVWPN